MLLPLNCNRLYETAQMKSHNICFYAELTKIIPKLSPNTPSYLELCKVMSIIFCDTRRIELNHMVSANTTINSYYANIIWVSLQRAIQGKHPDFPRSLFILHQENNMLLCMWVNMLSPHSSN